VPGFVLFFSFLALNPLEPIILNIPTFFGALTSQLEKSKASSATSTTLDKHSFQTKGTIFLGGHPNLRKKQLQKL